MSARQSRAVLDYIPIKTHKSLSANILLDILTRIYHAWFNNCVVLTVMEDLMATIRLEELAKARGLNLSQVQRRTGLTMGAVRRYWHNTSGMVSLDALDKLAALLKVQPGELIGPGRGHNERASGAGDEA